MIRQSDPVGVAPEVAEDLLGAAERGLGVGSSNRACDHCLNELGSLELRTVENDISKRIVYDTLTTFMYMNVDAKFLRSRSRPDHSRSRSPHRVGASIVLVKIQRSAGRFIFERLGELIVQRLERSRDDRLTAPGAIATAISTKMLSMRLSTKVAKIQVGVPTTGTADAVHSLARLKTTDELEGCRRGHVYSRDVMALKQFQAVTVQYRDCIKVFVDGFLPISLGPDVDVNLGGSRLDAFR